MPSWATLFPTQLTLCSVCNRGAADLLLEGHLSETGTLCFQSATTQGFREGDGERLLLF
jgi:hypothetical protein